MKKYIVSVILALSLNSCKEFLDREPVDQISINAQMSTKKGITDALNGAYYKLRDTELGIARGVYADLLSGNMVYTPNPSINVGVIDASRFVGNIYDFNDQKDASNLSDFYKSSYEIINNLNLILENLDKASDVNDADKAEIKAEALSLRAYVHFSLYKIYAQNYTYTSDASHLGIAYNDKTLKVGVDYPTRKTVKETFDLLYSDLENALNLYQNSPAISLGEKKNYFTKTAAKTLFAEVALWRNDWQKAKTMSSEAIAESGLSLTPKNDLATQFAVPETILEMPVTAESASDLAILYNYTSATNFSEFAVSQDVMDLFENGDARKNFYEKILVKTKVGTAMQNLPYYFVRKYKTPTAGLLYRLSELYFIRAEASLNLNDNAQALADVNLIRTRAGIPALTSITMDALLKEKRLEFVGENKYFFDLMRNHRGVVRNQGCISQNCSMAYPSQKFVLPIPASSIYVNSYMQQNPGY